jgi:hypothetical protein
VALKENITTSYGEYGAIHEICWIIKLINRQKGLAQFKMTRILFIFFSLSFNTFCKTDNTSDCFEYPTKIQKLKSIDIYDNARWILFNWLGAKKLDGIYYGQMVLEYKDVISRNDTMVIFFNFYESNKSAKKKKELTLVANARVAFKQSTKQCIWTFLYPFEDFSDGLRSGDKRLQILLSDITSKFIKEQNNIINVCYLELARRKKLID